MHPPAVRQCQNWESQSEMTPYVDTRCVNPGAKWVEHVCDCSEFHCPRLYYTWECDGPCSFEVDE